MGSNSNTRSNSIVEFGFTDDRELENGGSNSLMAGSWAAKVRGDKGAEGDVYSPTASASAMDTQFPPPSATAAVVGPKLNGNGPAHIEISATGVDSNGVFHPQSQRLQQQHQQQQEQQQQHYNHSLQPPPQQQQQAHHYQGGYIGMVHNGSDMGGLMPIGAHHDHHPHHLFDPHQQHQAFLDPNMALGMVPHHMMGGLPMLAPPGVGGLAIEGGEPLGALGGMGGLGGGLEMDGGGGHDYGGGNGGAHAAAAVALTGDGFENSKEYTLGLFPCVRLSGLAATTSVNDVMMFFTGLGPVLDIVLDPARSGGGDGGEQTLDAVVLFGNMMDYHGALQRYSLQLLGRYVEVAPALRGDYYAAIMQRDACAAAAAAQQQQPPLPPAAELDAHLLLSEALPSVETPASAPAAQLPAAVAVGDDAGTPVAVAADSSASHDDDNVEQQPAAPSPQDASQAASAAAAGGAPSVVANGGSAGGEAAATPTAAAGAAAGAAPAAGAKAAAAGAAAAAAGGADGGGKGPVTVIRMRGLPYRASKADIMAFFQGCAVAEVNFVARADGRVTGEAYVKFASREDARQGLRRDRDMIGNRYIELFTSSPEEMARYLKRHS